MKLVNLVSGGLDSTLVGVLAREEGMEIFPLFVDYGQRAAKKEWDICVNVHNALNMPAPIKMNLCGFGEIIQSGLTSPALDIKEDAFTPGRNLLFLLAGSSYAYQVGAGAVAIGLLAEQFSLFPDQRKPFLNQAEETIKIALGRSIAITAPLFDFSKADVVKLAQEKGVAGTYSCHSGNDTPCGRCISCLEFKLTKEA
ncbi:MAG: 7-cyano-7-deazaguanine synthase [Alphaproteobacteria bacterium]|nr:MAG: 7-cyano-7-deazaguanine synthase [Alphaproteobacteria bacterium]